jgi:hypothetical protein
MKTRVVAMHLGFFRAAALCLAVLALAVGLPAQKASEVEVAQIETTRFEGQAGFTGRIKVKRQRPIRGLVMSLEFFDAQRVLLTILKQDIEQGEVNAGDEIEFDLGGKDVPRAVSFRVVMHDSRDEQLSVAGGGPHPF